MSPRDHRRRRRRRPRSRRPPEPVTLRSVAAGVWAVAPRLMVLFGALAAVVTVVALPAAIHTVDENTALHRDGVATTAVVVSVRKEHHTSRHGGWDEYVPTTQQTVAGLASTTELERYSSRSEDRFHRGQRLAVLVDRDDPETVVLASAEARRGAVRHLHGTVAVAVVGGAMLVVGVPVVVVRHREDPKRKRRRERAARQRARERGRVVRTAEREPVE